MVAAIQAAVPGQTWFNELEKRPRTKVNRNMIAMKSIQDYGVVSMGIRRKEVPAVCNMAIDVLWQTKITMGQDKSVRVHIDDSDFAAGTCQHRSERTATAADHQYALRVRLKDEVINSMDVGSQAHTIAVRLTLTAAELIVDHGACQNTPEYRHDSEERLAIFQPDRCDDAARCGRRVTFNSDAIYDGLTV